MKGRATDRRFEGARTRCPRRVSRKNSCGLLAVAAIAAAAPLVSRAGVDNWQVGSGNWSTPGNWTTGVPANGSDVYITEGDATNRVVTYDYTGTNGFSSLTIDNTGTGTNTLSQSAHLLAVTGNEYVGLEGNAVVNQSGGTNAIGGDLAIGGENFALGDNGYGTYNLSASGSLTVAGREFVSYNGQGFFNQTGGTHTAGSLYVAVAFTGNSTFKLSGGTLTVSGEEQMGINGAAIFDQSGGTHIFTSTLKLGLGRNAHGTYILSGGLVQSIQDVAKNGTVYLYPVTIGSGQELGSRLNVSGGTFDSGFGGVWVNDPSPLSGEMNGINLSGGTVTTAGLAMPDWSRLNFTGGTLNITGGAVGSSVNPGLLTVGDSGGSAVLNQYFIPGGGSASSTITTVGAISLRVGNSFDSSGTYNLSGSAFLNVINEEYVSYDGPGVFNQSGGTNSAGELFLGGSSGTYNLSNGSLNAGQEFVGESGTGVFNQTGGTHSAGYLSMANLPGTTGTYNLSGSGVLNVTGSGEYVGFAGSGVLNQTGGTHTISRPLYAAYLPASSGTINLSGGLLTASGVQLGGGDGSAGGLGILNVSGGALDAGTNAITVFNGTNISGINLSGGTTSAGFLVLPDWSRLNFSGGTLNLGAGGGVSSNTGTLSVGTGTTTTVATLNVTAGGVFADGASIGLNSGSGTVNQSGGAFTLNQQLFLGSGGGKGIYNLSGGSLTVTVQENIGLGAGGSGTFTQTGGTNHALSLVDIGNGEPGTYNLQAGTLNAASAIDIAINGANASYNQSGGVANAIQVRVGAFGTGGIGIVNLSGGSLGVQNVLLGGIGTSAVAVGILNSTGGSLTASNGITIYDSAVGTNVSSMTINGGTVSTASIFAPDWSRLNFVRGTLTLTGGVSSNAGTLSIGSGSVTGALLNLNGGALYAPNEFLGNGAAGAGGRTFQSAGSSNVITSSGFLLMGPSPATSGTYTLSGGSLTAPNEAVGYSGFGTLTQSAGSNATPFLTLGFNAGAAGTANLTGGTLTVPSNEVVGYSGRGILNQSGGTNVAGFLATALNAGSSGTVNLSGGTLTAGSTLNNGTFNQTGGTANLGALSGTGLVFVGNTAAAAAAALMTVTSFAQNLITVRNTGTLRVATNAARVTNTATTLTITGSGLLDLGNNALLVNNVSTPEATVRQYLHNGYSADASGIGNWLGTGGITAADAIASHNGPSPDFRISVGYVNGNYANDPLIAGPIPGQETLPTNRTLIRPALYGDLNLDGKVDDTDLAIFSGLGQYNKPTDKFGWLGGDLNQDGKVDDTDLQIFSGAGNYNGPSYGAASGAQASHASATPSLTGHAEANGDIVLSSSTSQGAPGDGVLDFVYDPSTGHLTLSYDGDPRVTAAQPFQVVRFKSAGGHFIPANFNQADFGAGVTATTSALNGTASGSNSVPDGYDMGAVLPTGLTVADLTSDLTLQWNVFGGGLTLKNGDVVVPEPGALLFACAGVATAVLGRRRRRRQGTACL